MENKERTEKALESLRASTKVVTSPAGIKNTSHHAYDAFICHASEDKDDLVRPLAEELRRLGVRIWFDEFQLKVGDSLRRSIDRGLVKSRFGIVVLSPAFFAKNWPQYELDGLVAREVAIGAKIVLPLWHKVSMDEVIHYSPSLADKVALSTAMASVSKLATDLTDVIMEVEHIVPPDPSPSARGG